jgi:rhamnosyltransferase
MIAQSVCAVIVTYHPNAEIIKRVSTIRPQVQGLVAVDNGSSSAELCQLRESAETLCFQLIENGENRGIAEALNQGVLWAKSKGYQWVILLDQDSRAPDNFVDCMLRSWNRHPQKELIASLQPRYANPLSGRESSIARAKESGPTFYMTSGSLMPVWIFDKIGFFAAEYFIDYVDFEYCLRARAAGYLIVESEEAVLCHAPGELKEFRRFGFVQFQTSNHSAIRRYYLVRNRVATARKYFRKFPVWTVKDLMHTRKEIVKIILGEKDKGKKLAAMLRGLIDGLTGRMGKVRVP